MDYLEQIRAGDPAGIEELYRTFYKGIRWWVSRQLGRQDIDDKVHDALLMIVQAIRRGELRDPACLASYVRTVVRHLIAAHIGRVVETRSRQAELESAAKTQDSRSNPEQDAAARQEVEIMKKVLLDLSPRNREVLTRFYLLEQNPHDRHAGHPRR